MVKQAKQLHNSQRNFRKSEKRAKKLKNNIKI